MSVSRLARRVVRQTLLAVGEGYAEQHLLKHCRNLYTKDHLGPAVSIANARGKGARHVIEYAARVQGSYDLRAAFFDADTDWDQSVEAMARRLGVRVCCFDPCVEAVLLDVNGFGGERDTAASKQEFVKRFGGEAHQAGLIVRNFSRASFEAARLRVSVVDTMISSFGA